MSILDGRIGGWVVALVWGIVATALWAQHVSSLVFGTPQLSTQALVAALTCAMTGLAIALTVGSVIGLRRADQSRLHEAGPEDSWWRLCAGVGLMGVGADPIFQASPETSDLMVLAVAFFAGGGALGLAAVVRAVGPLRTRKSTSRLAR